MRTAYILIGLAAGLTAAGGATAQPAGKTAPLADKLPADSLVYVGWAGAGDIKGTSLDKMLNEPEVKLFVEKTMAALEKGLEKNIPAGGVAEIYQSARRLLVRVKDRPAAVALMALAATTQPGTDADAAPAGRAAIIDAGLVIDGGAEAEAIEGELAVLFGRIVPAARKVQIGAATVQQVELDRDAPPLSWGVVGQYVIVALGKDAPAKLAETLSGGGRKLADQERFKKVLARTGTGSLVAYADVDSLMHKSLANLAAFGGDPQADMIIGIVRDALGLGSLEAVGEAISADGGDLVDRVWLATPKGKPGLLALLDQRPMDADFLKAAPADATFVLAGNLDAAKAIAELETQVRKYPAAAGVYSMGLATVEQMLNLKIKDELLASVGDGVMLYNSPNAGGFLLTGLTAVVELKDAAAFKASLGRLEDALKANLHKSEQAGGRIKGFAIERTGFKVGEAVYEIHYLRTFDEPNPVAPAWTVTDKYFVISLYPQMLREAVLQIAAGKASILDNPDFKRLGDRTPNGAFTVNYIDDRQIARIVYKLLPPVWALAAACGPQADFDLDPAWLPTQESIVKHLTGTVLVGVSEQDGVLFETRGALPGAMCMGAVGQAVGLAPALLWARLGYPVGAEDFRPSPPVEVENPPMHAEGNF